MYTVQEVILLQGRPLYIDIKMDEVQTKDVEILSYFILTHKFDSSTNVVFIISLCPIWKAIAGDIVFLVFSKR